MDRQNKIKDPNKKECAIEKTSVARYIIYQQSAKLNSPRQSVTLPHNLPIYLNAMFNSSEYEILFQKQPLVQSQIGQFNQY